MEERSRLRLVSRSVDYAPPAYQESPSCDRRSPSAVRGAPEHKQTTSCVPVGTWQRSGRATFVSASAGLFRDLNIDPHIGPGYPVKPDQTVWAVKFAGEVTICDPLGACFSPRPGITAVYLDYETGDFLSAGGVTPAP